jgi:prepilin-type N-terminal cleavage/methylation domain-containing protein
VSQRGFSMLEVLVVLGIISVLSAMLVPSSQENVSLERVIGNAKLLSQKLVELSVDARASGRMVRLDCNSTGIRATTYRNTRSRFYGNAIASNIISANIPLIPVSASTRLVCPTSNPIYITSEGYVFSASSPGITGLELRSGPYGARLLVSAAGVSTISAGVVGRPFNEL